MFRGLRVAVVVPAYNEAQAIARTIASVPDFVDRVIVIDDASTDGTGDLAEACFREGLEVARHAENRGVGGAIVTGYHRALARGADAVCVMAGDAQMDPNDLATLLGPIAAGRADYVKGNRFLSRDVWRVMPPSRLCGNIVLSLANKVVTGYWDVFDSQCGYTAITRAALQAIDLARLFPRYGYPIDLLARLHAARARVVDVPVRPVYGPDWRSGIRLSTVAHPITFVMARALSRRLAAEWGRPVRPALVARS